MRRLSSPGLNEIRKKIYDLISKNPGLHLSKLAELLNIRSSLAEYHLTYMEKHNLIFSVKKEGEYYRRYFLVDSDLGVRDKAIISNLNRLPPVANFLPNFSLFCCFWTTATWKSFVFSIFSSCHEYIHQYENHYLASFIPKGRYWNCFDLLTNWFN